MRERKEKGFTTLELIITVAIVAVLGTVAYLFSTSSSKTEQITPVPTKAPTTLTITHGNQPNALSAGYTIKVNDTNVANAILDDISQLPMVPKGKTLNCPNDTADIYTLHFTEPVETFSADYGGCDLVTQSGGLTRIASGQNGKTFWSDINKATNRPL